MMHYLSCFGLLSANFDNMLSKYEFQKDKMTFRTRDRSNHILRTIFYSFSFWSISYHIILQRRKKGIKKGVVNKLGVIWSKGGGLEKIK